MEGLVYAFALDGSGGASRLGWGETGAAQATLWLHIDYKDEQSAEWLRKESGIPPLICDALIDEDTRPRMLATEGGLLVVLRGANFNPGADPEDMVSIRLWVEGQRIITMRHRRVMAVEDVLADLRRGRGPRNPLDFMMAIADRITDRIATIVSDIVDRMDTLEDSVIESPGEELRSDLATLRRQAISFKRFLAPQREVFHQLHTEESFELSPGLRNHMKELHELTTRYVEDLDLARERAAITHEEIAAKLSEQMNRTMYLMSIVAAIFLPLGLVTGLLGINVGGVPLAGSGWGFPVVCGLLAVIAVAEVIFFRWRKYL